MEKPEILVFASDNTEGGGSGFKHQALNVRRTTWIMKSLESFLDTKIAE